ncbi:helix-turn-helix transcriptional regulator [Streptomyces sp. NPDC002795]|uniref:helix-turn-helix transcriptional regulator n=1 Tax=Streptomyces sp. NPDC002795 TaxID=3364665 RepID=UPI0036918978
MTTTEIAAEHGVSRQTVHAHRKSGAFPKPVEGEGSTRPRFRADEVAAFFAANPPSPGKRTDLPSRDEGVPMNVTELHPAGVPEADLTKGERLANVLSYQTGVAAQKIGLTEGQAERAAQAVVRAVQEVSADWDA